jgi:hypothetical protein
MTLTSCSILIFPCSFLVADQYLIDAFDEQLLLSVYACALLQRDVL